MSAIIGHLTTAKTIIETARAKLGRLQGGWGNRIDEINELIARKESLMNPFSFDNIPELIEIYKKLTLSFLDVNGERERMYAAALSDIDISAIETDLMDAWDKLSVLDRNLILRQIHIMVSEELGIDPINVRFTDIPDYPSGIDRRSIYDTGDEGLPFLSGFWDPFDNDPEILIDSDNVEGDRFWLLADAVVHETRHRYQHLIIDGAIPRPDSITEEQVEQWKKEFFDDNVSSSNDYDEYKAQSIERDADAYEDEFLGKDFISDETPSE